ncbi:hypothetical protein GW17_00003262 [Ensete ventricosum]|nr:hypothetical protein GW17_00003262 [Ensete ventricosum]
MDSEVESWQDMQMPFLPSVEVLVKCLLLIAPAAVSSLPRSYSQLIFCSHHPCIASTGTSNEVWKVTGAWIVRYRVVPPNSPVGGRLREKKGRRRRRKEERRKIIPRPVLARTPSPLAGRPRAVVAHGSPAGDFSPAYFLRQKDNYPVNKEFMLLRPLLRKTQNIQRVVLRFMMTKMAWRMYHLFLWYKKNQIKENLQSQKKIWERPVKEMASLSIFLDLLIPGSWFVVELRHVAYCAAPVEKVKTAKEEARELMLKEESAIRQRVKCIQRNLSVMLTALGEMAIANPVFTHGQLPSLVSNGYLYCLFIFSLINVECFIYLLQIVYC